jgi:iron-sulfur cluster assembly protein
MQPDTAMSTSTAVNPASCTSGPGNGPLAEIALVTEGMKVGLTEAAARHIQRYIGRRGKGVGVRLGVKTTGCSGLAYKIEFADEVAPEDLIFEQLGVKILVDPKSLPYIDGTELDFVREGLNEGFKFNNPNERDRCGCGESFRI